MNANEHLDFYNPDSIYYGNSRHYIQQLENKVRQQQAKIEALKDIVERLIADWSDGFKNYEYNSDEPEENKLRDDVFAILRKASEKC